MQPKNPFRRMNVLDTLIGHADKTLKTLIANGVPPERPSPAQTVKDAELTEKEKKQIAGLMRINHTGEVCAQGLYQGQALTAKSKSVKTSMEKAAREEDDHLAWCYERLQQLNSRPSLLNPIYYSMSYTLGATAGLISDKVSLGFIAATEEQVCHHLNSHLIQLPQQDEKSKVILEQMLIDEKEHGDKALKEGGYEFPLPVKQAMTLVSKLMTVPTYRI